VNVTDPIADMLTRIRNAVGARHDTLLVPASQLKVNIARILKEEGYLKDFELTKDNPKMLKLWIRYTGRKQPALSGIRRISKPGLRVYSKSDEMPRVLRGLGMAVVSTPMGVMTAKQARRLNVGGEVLCYVW
jgi:small subunit ribosomal protein S8